MSRIKREFKLRFYLLFVVAGLFIGNTNNAFGQSDWIAPKSADNLKNPISGNEAALQAGKKLYTQLCSICHGDKGKGDGIASLSLKPKPGNFTSTKVQQQSDGAIFWKLTNGRAPMASYKESLTDEKRWQLVTYLRSFRK